MTQLFKDDHLYETELIDNPNYKLQSLRDYSALDNNITNELAAQNKEDDENSQKIVDSDEEEAVNNARVRYQSDESLYD